MEEKNQISSDVLQKAQKQGEALTIVRGLTAARLKDVVPISKAGNKEVAASIVDKLKSTHPNVYNYFMKNDDIKVAELLSQTLGQVEGLLLEIEKLLQ